MMSLPLEIELADAIEVAAKKAICELFQSNDENFYYCSLITTGEANPPVLSAWSWEALQRIASKSDSPEETAFLLKWSYADSPFFAFGDGYFSEVRNLFFRRPRMDFNMSPEQWYEEFGLRLRAMETAMARLDAQGLFGHGDRRTAIVINVEVMPPNHENIERAIRLNPKEALSEWMAEAAENC